MAMTCMGTSGEFWEPNISPGIYDDITFGLWIVDGRLDGWNVLNGKHGYVLSWYYGIAPIEIHALMATAMDGGSH